MDPRQAARFLQSAADRAAAKTAAIRRANVSEVRSDGRAVVLWSNGAKTLIPPSATPDTPYVDQQALALVRQGGRWEALAQSAYQGGLGAPLSPPPEP